MTPAQLYHFNGAPVHITVDGASALGLLFFSERGGAYITSLCFLESGRKCPLLRHKVTELELKTFSKKSRNRLESGIAMTSAPSAPLRAKRVR